MIDYVKPGSGYPRPDAPIIVFPKPKPPVEEEE